MFVRCINVYAYTIHNSTIERNGCLTCTLLCVYIMQSKHFHAQCTVQLIFQVVFSLFRFFHLTISMIMHIHFNQIQCRLASRSLKFYKNHLTKSLIHLRFVNTHWTMFWYWWWWSYLSTTNSYYIYEQISRGQMRNKI